jgi:hypothetical protein
VTDIQTQCAVTFAAVAAVQVWLVWKLRRVRERQRRRFPLRWIAWAGGIVACVAVVLATEAFLTTTRAYETLSYAGTSDLWSDTVGHLRWMWQPAAGLCVVLLGLAWHPRSLVATAGLVVAAGVLVSLMVATWLFVTNHDGLVFGILVLPGGLGLVSAFIGFGVATTLWMAISRWIWRAPV